MTTMDKESRNRELAVEGQLPLDLNLDLESPAAARFRQRRGLLAGDLQAFWRLRPNLLYGIPSLPARTGSDPRPSG